LAIFTIDDQSNILFANPAVEKVFGYKGEELIGGKLTVVMPEYLRHVHEHGLARYVATGQRHVSWDGVSLPGLHKNGHEIPLVISFGEFVRGGKRGAAGCAWPSATAPNLIRLMSPNIELLGVLFLVRKTSAACQES